MTDPGEALQDLEFIKSLVLHTRVRASGMAPYFILWGFIWMVGFSSPLWLRSEWTGWLWTVLDAVGVAASIWIGIGQTRRHGPAPGPWSKINWTFLPLMLLGVVLAFFALRGGIAPEYMPGISVVIVGTGYLQAGVVLGREMQVIGTWLLILGVTVPTWFLPYQSLLFGILGGGSLVATGFILRRWGSRPPAASPPSAR